MYQFFRIYNCDNNCLGVSKSVLSRLKNFEVYFFSLGVLEEAKTAVITVGLAGAFKTVRIRER